MNHYIIHNADTVPAASAELYAAVEKSSGFVPNIYAAMAESPSAMEGFVALTQAFANSSFSIEEQQIIQLATSTENGCVYCVAGHTAFAASTSLSQSTVTAMREYQPVTDTRLETLNRTARSLINNRGQITEQEVSAFIQAGFTRAQILELVMGISLKTFSNYSSNLLGIPLDHIFKRHSWERPDNAIKGAA